MLHSAVGRSLGDCPELGGRRILPLGESVNLVVEKYDIDVYVPAYCVDEMVSAYCKGISITAGLPHGEVGIRHLDTCGYGCGAAVDRVEAIGVHIIGQSGRAAYARDHHIAFLAVAQDFGHIRKGSLQGRKHRVVTATGAPAHLLV